MGIKRSCWRWQGLTALVSLRDQQNELSHHPYPYETSFATLHHRRTGRVFGLHRARNLTVVGFRSDGGFACRRDEKPWARQWHRANHRDHLESDRRRLEYPLLRRWHPRDRRDN